MQRTKNISAWKDCKRYFLPSIKTKVKMDDTLLLDAIERYKKGEMTAQERTFFEEMRKYNPDIDQMAVEHTFFLNELERLGDRKAYKHTLDEVENTLVNEGIIAKK